MSLLKTIPAPTTCPRCGGPMYRGYDGDASCLYCGEYVYTRVEARRLLAEPEGGRRKRGRPRKATVAA
ncbi:MAG: hypothetical protein IRZ14_03330 [Chloroflexi bacterium]|jgi:uncharacterized Zn finger protein (UPF0148 family)|nr:hypothetical protein [Chloroflexota bacterium]